MDIRKMNDIRVYSELPFQINLVGQHREYVFPPCVDGERPMNFVDFSDIEYANSRCNSFTLGLLIFDEDLQDEIYQALGIRDWKKKVWFNKDIIDVIEHPTLEKMQRIIDIKEPIALERIRAQVVHYTNMKKDISQKVVNIVNARYREINAGTLGSKIEVRPIDIEAPMPPNEAEELKRQIAEQNKKIEEQNAMMQKLMDQLSAKMQSSETGDDETEKKTATRQRTKKTVMAE